MHPRRFKSKRVVLLLPILKADDTPREEQGEDGRRPFAADRNLLCDKRPCSLQGSWRGLLRQVQCRKQGESIHKETGEAGDGSQHNTVHGASMKTEKRQVHLRV